jgi:hypothetical protein
MASVRSRDTKPELIVRRYLHKRGLRYVLHDSGSPVRQTSFFTRESLPCSSMGASGIAALTAPLVVSR